jgi:hypothetical protein
MLTLLEELLLLTLDDEKGTVIPNTLKRSSYALSGAALAELALSGRVSVDDSGCLEATDSKETGDLILESMLRKIQTSKKKRKLLYWVSTLANRPKKLRRRVGERLVAKGVLTQQGGHYTWIIPSPESSNLAGPAKYAIKENLRSVILTGAPADVHCLALLSLLRGGKLLKLVFTRDELPIARQRIYEMLLGEAIRNPVAQRIEEIEQAVKIALNDAEG